MAVLVVRVGPDDVESCSDWLWQLGATAIEERPDELVVGFASDEAALQARSLLSERWPCRLESTGDEAAWRDEWLRWIEPVEVSGFWVHAPWHDPSLWPADAETISIDPGHAFGSGHHPTTQLAIGALRDLVQPGDRVLDAGCGTGILSIAAAKLGAGQVTGVDLDHDILEVAAANIEANDLQTSVELATDSVVNLDQRFDVVVANIVIGDLAPLLGPLVDITERSVIVSGFLDDQLERLLQAVDVRVAHRSVSDDWACAVLTPLR